MAKHRGTVEVIPARRRSNRAPVKPSEIRYIEVPPEDQRSAELFDALGEGDAEAQYIDAALQGVMTELGATDENAKVTIFRCVSGNGVRKEEWLNECHPREFSIAQLQTDFGPGDYRVRVYGKQEGSNYRVVHADKKISIGEAPGAKKAGAVAATPAAPAKDELARTLAEVLAGPLTAMTQMLAQATKAPSRAEMLEEMRQMREIFGPAGNAPQADPLAMLEKAMLLMKANASSAPIVNEDGEVAPGTLIAQGIGLVREFLDTARAGRVNGALPAPEPQPPQPDRMHAPMPQPAAPQPRAEIAQQGDDQMGLMLKAQLGLLLHAAKQDMDTSLYSGLIYEQAPDDVLAKLESESWWDELVKLEPGFAAFKPWCEKLRGEVVQIIAEENATESGEATGTATGEEKPAN